MSADEMLAADPDFAAVCDARRAAWIEALDADLAAGDALARCDGGADAQRGESA